MKARKVFANSIVPLHAEQGLTLNGLMVNAATAEDKREKLTLHFSLKTPNQDELEERVAKGEVISPEELKKKYSPSQASRKKLEAWLEKEGFEVLDAEHDGSSVYARASISQIEKSLAVKTARVTKDGVTYTAAQSAPSLPADVAEDVDGIIGLQPYRGLHKHLRMNLHNLETRLSAKDELSAAPNPNIANRPPYLVSEILKAYNGNGLGLTGKGQTIAILIDTFPLDSDLIKFWKDNNLSCTMAQVTKINVKGGALPPRAIEETLDASWTSGIAPGAKIRIYASGSLQFPDLDRAMDQILVDAPKIPGMRQVSISLGLGETYMASSEVSTQHAKFLKLAALGVNVFVSTGDAGSNPDQTGHNSTGPTQAEYESSDPCVVAVGGTTLRLSTGTGSVSSESGWTSGGGGKSLLFPRPVWQAGANMPAGNHRLVPDVSSAADPNTGAYLVYNGQGTGIGGTSWSAPTWAGFCALINESRANNKKKPLSFLNPLIYPLSGSGVFRDITHGNNGAYSAGPGYDMVTGIGVPNLQKLAKALG
jgi:kumamolisin